VNAEVPKKLHSTSEYNKSKETIGKARISEVSSDGP
jgi:hypothetical protein